MTTETETAAHPPASPAPAAEVALRPQMRAGAAAELNALVAFARHAQDSTMLLPARYQGRPADIMLAKQFALDLGMPLHSILTGIFVTDGKPAPTSGLQQALVRRAGHRLRVAVQRDERGRAYAAVATVTRADDPDFTFDAAFSLEDAARAQLCTLDADGRPRARSKNGKVLPWEAYPEAMLKARAVSQVARDACQDALMGMIYTPEELGAVVNEDGEPVPAAALPPAVAPPVEQAGRAAHGGGSAPAGVNTATGEIVDGEVVVEDPPASELAREQASEPDPEHVRKGMQMVANVWGQEPDLIRTGYRWAESKGLLALDVGMSVTPEDRRRLGLDKTHRGVTLPLGAFLLAVIDQAEGAGDVSGAEG